MDVNQFREIKDGDCVSRVFNLPLGTSDGDPMHMDAPPTSDWHPLPERFLEGIDFASKFIGTAKGRSAGWRKVEFAHVMSGKVFATNNLLIVEHDIGRCDLTCTLTLKQVRMIKAFGATPTHAVVVGETTSERILHFKWADGNRLSLRHSFDPASELSDLFDSYDWEGFAHVDDEWRAQVVGHFSFKPLRDNDGLLTVYPDRITGGIFDNRPDTELLIETHSGREVAFEQATFLKAVKIASGMKFIHDGDHSRLLFKGEHTRGIAASRHRVQS